MIGSSRAIALAVVLTCFPFARAHADPPPASPTKEQLDTARSLFHDARELHRQGKLKEAIERALEAYRVAPTPVTAMESAQLLVEAGRLVEARDITRAVPLIPVSPRESDKGRGVRQEALTLAGALDGRIPKIAIAERPRDLEVLLDGKALAATDSSAWQGVDPGAHTLVVRAGDRACTTINVTLVEGEARTIDLHDAAAACRPEPPPVPSASPSPAPQAVAPIAPRPSAIAPAPASNEQGGHPWRWTGAAIAGAGLVAVGIGTVIAISAKSDYDSVAGECRPRCSLEGYDVRQSARSRADVATATLLIGAAATTGGALLFFLAPRTGDARRPEIALGLSGVRLTVGFE